MCGIVGYVGPDEALPIVLEGLRRLEYRGYDSAGVAVLDGGLGVVKRAGKLGELEAALDEEGNPTGSVGMGHTRWATHGAPTDRNAHPHLDCGGHVAVIHNGIIENHQSLRVRLEKEGHSLVSETDTECVAHLVEEKLRDGGPLADAVRAAVRELEGAFSLVVCSLDEPDALVGVKVSSPLIVGLGDGETLLASDIPAVLHRTTTVVPLDEGMLVEVRAAGATFTDLDGMPLDPAPITVDWDVARAQKGGYETFMRKEIDEQPAAIRDTLVGRMVGERLVLDELRGSDDALREVTKVFVVACGTAFHSGLVAKYAIEHWTRLPVEAEIASEFRYRDPVLGPDTLTLAVSQSGETIDTLEAARHARRQGSQVIAVTNTVGSSLAREADGVLYTHAGPEIGVAATKTFATQMVSQYLVALYLAQVRGTKFPEEIAEVLTELDQLPAKVERAIALDDQVRALAERYRDARDVLFIGRHTGYPAALEGALKLKELSYVHAEGHPAGELKHGPIALIEDGVPVVAVATRCHVYPKMLSNIQEVRARGARVIAVATEGDTEVGALADHVLHVPATPELMSPVVVTVPMQLLAYHVATMRGCDVDQPRNLAKSVTVE
ncbi:MAG: glutamine--fructose-6-phosphate transaminase (isomerizing) [Actinomycetota bacterium]|nr:glutamine--fructose-6-phosphate transaminase (isomerizing) [Actinomycetota bacterium]MDH5225221.1 glutamine--fructose-6-phosphate transaminase (isomerizing) [Actinomycetota bacterium]